MDNVLSRNMSLTSRNYESGHLHHAFIVICEGRSGMSKEATTVVQDRKRVGAKKKCYCLWLLFYKKLIMVTNYLKESDLKPGPEFLESNITLSLQQENRLKQMGTTVTNASSYTERYPKR
nr:putative glutamine amidotransferase PB2B2.05 [Tanacetum cinerariifolium]